MEARNVVFKRVFRNRKNKNSVIFNNEDSVSEIMEEAKNIIRENNNENEEYVEDKN